MFPIQVPINKMQIWLSLPLQNNYNGQGVYLAVWITFALLAKWNLDVACFIFLNIKFSKLEIFWKTIKNWSLRNKWWMSLYKCHINHHPWDQIFKEIVTTGTFFFFKSSGLNYGVLWKFSSIISYQIHLSRENKPLSAIYRFAYKAV